MTRLVRVSAPACLIALAALLPFIDKAFSIDDPIFIRTAAYLLQHPLHPTGFVVQSTGAPLSWLRYLTMAYLLLPSAALGCPEWAAHSAVFALLLVAIIATVSLGLRIGLDEHQARLAGVLFATTPAVLAMASTIMPDVPATAFGVLSVERLLAWKQEGRWHQAAVGILALLAASLARSHTVLLLGVCVLMFFDGTVSKAGRWPLVVAAAALAGLASAGMADGADTLRVGWGVMIESNAFALPVNWALSTPFAAAWFLAHPRALSAKTLWLSMMLAVSILIANRQTEWIWLVPAAGLGITAVVETLISLRRDGTGRFLAAWLFLAAPLVFYDHLPAKYLAPSMPAAALLIARALPTGWRRHAIAIAAPAAGLLLSIAVMRADAAWAGLARSTAPTLVDRSIPTWNDGAFAFEYYATKAGAPPVAPSSALKRGDRVIRARINAGQLERYPNRVLLRTVDGPRTIGRAIGHGAGFFSNGWGYLPWAWGGDELDRFEVWEIR
jgi:hypothetical protein